MQSVSLKNKGVFSFSLLLASCAEDSSTVDTLTSENGGPSDECKGFEVLGLKHSPGGSTLPNKCAPFDGVTNNPYAIRCIDADPSYKTNYPGDEYCILPPPPNLGTQVHVGPNPGETGLFELAPGVEETRSYHLNASLTEDHFFYRTNLRTRSGSHHMVVSTSAKDREDGWAATTSEMPDLAGLDPSMFDPSMFDPSMFDPSKVDPELIAALSEQIGASGDFGVTQRVDQDRPQGTLEVPPENLGLGGELKANQQMTFNLHHINTGDQPILREVWVNIWYMDAQAVTSKMQPLAITSKATDLAIPAKQRTTLTYKCGVTGDTRIISLYGHRHAQTERFGVWVEKASGEKLAVYESFSWDDQPTYQYDSISTNPAPSIENRVDGASSGELELVNGDTIYFVCDINNQLDVPLKFASETITGEMCILFGSYVGAEMPCSGQPERVDAP